MGSVYLNVYLKLSKLLGQGNAIIVSAVTSGFLMHRHGDKELESFSFLKSF